MGAATAAAHGILGASVSHDGLYGARAGGSVLGSHCSDPVGFGAMSMGELYSTSSAGSID